jgi:hypothetical protein
MSGNSGGDQHELSQSLPPNLPLIAPLKVDIAAANLRGLGPPRRRHGDVASPAYRGSPALEGGTELKAAEGPAATSAASRSSHLRELQRQLRCR